MQVLFVLNIEFILLSHLFNQKVLSIEAFLLIALYLFVRYTLVRLSFSYKSYRSIFLPILAKETIYFKASFIVLKPYIYTTNDPLMTSNLDLKGIGLVLNNIKILCSFLCCWVSFPKYSIYGLFWFLLIKKIATYTKYATLHPWDILARITISH